MSGNKQCVVMLAFLLSGPKSLSMGGTFRGGMQKESRTITLQNGK